MSDYINVKTEQTQTIDLHALMESCTEGQLQHITNWIYKYTGLFPQKLDTQLKRNIALPEVIVISGNTYRNVSNG